ncbi:MAG: hypothetical protein ACK5XH_05140 [Lysobacteraceae bacterium]
MSDTEKDQFDIYIDYAKDTGDASRVFHAMGGLIDAFEQFDSLFAGVISEHATAELVLHDIEAASLKAKLRSVIGGIPDDALRDGEWKKVLGHFLIEAKHALCEWLDENPKISTLDQVQTLEIRIAIIAEKSGARHFPMYRPLDKKALLGSIAELDRSTSMLDPQDDLRYVSPHGEVRIAHSQHVNDELIREILTKEILASEDVRIVKIKKPDFLGNSQWVLKYSGHSINATIADTDWLSRFQDGETDVKPGDSLRVRMREQVYYGHHHEVVHISYEVMEVLDVLKPRPSEQRRLTF